MANPLENDCENANTHTHGGIHLVGLAHLQRRLSGVDVDQLGEEMEVKGETPPAECPPVECGQSDGATGALDRKDGGHCK